MDWKEVKNAGGIIAQQRDAMREKYKREVKEIYGWQTNASFNSSDWRWMLTTWSSLEYQKAYILHFIKKENAFMIHHELLNLYRDWNQNDESSLTYVQRHQNQISFNYKKQNLFKWY